MQECDVICSCLSKNVVLLHDKEMEALGENKIFFNTALSPSYDMDAMEKWLSKKNTWYFCDTLMALGDEKLLEFSNVRCAGKSAGMTRQAVVRLNNKVLENLKEFAE